MAAADGRALEALPELRTAVEGFEELRLPFESARARLELAAVLAATAPELAVLEGGFDIETDASYAAGPIILDRVGS